MTPQQMIEFDARREAVLRAHLKQNPNYRKMMRDRRVAFAAGVVRYCAGMGLILFLIKAFLISQNGQQAYLDLVSSVLSKVPADSVVARAIVPDRYSLIVAAAMADLTAPRPQTAASVDDGLERIVPGVPGS